MAKDATFSVLSSGNVPSPDCKENRWGGVFPFFQETDLLLHVSFNDHCVSVTYPRHVQYGTVCCSL